MSLTLSSPAFRNGAAIPSKYTCRGEDISPPLQWGGISENTKSLALICDDPDAPAGTWVHWVAYNIPPAITEIPEKRGFGGKAAEGINDFRRRGYGGPCPPPGKPHRYYFKLYALDKDVTLKEGATKKELLKEIEGHIIQHTELMGTYQRK